MLYNSNSASNSITSLSLFSYWRCYHIDHFDKNLLYISSILVLVWLFYITHNFNNPMSHNFNNPMSLRGNDYSMFENFVDLSLISLIQKCYNSFFLKNYFNFLWKSFHLIKKTWTYMFNRLKLIFFLKK